jgi:integrase/recombinase XerD
MPIIPTAFRPPPRYMTQTEIRAFLRVITDPRDRVLFSLIYLYGLRVSEVSLLQRGDIDLRRKRIVVKRVKNGYWMERPLWASIQDLLESYLGGTSGSSEDALFPGRSGALRKRQIQSLFVRYRDRAQLARHYTCHCLRHSIATHLLDAGVSLEFVQDHLGHKNIQSTTIYARITDQHRVQQFRRLDASPWIVHPANASDSVSTHKEQSP